MGQCLRIVLVMVGQVTLSVVFLGQVIIPELHVQDKHIEVEAFIARIFGFSLLEYKN